MSGTAGGTDQRLVYVGAARLEDDNILGVVSASAAARHRALFDAMNAARTYGDVRAIEGGPLAEESDDEYDGERPGDDEPFDIDTDSRTCEAQWDWLPDEQTCIEFGDLLCDLGAEDTGWGLDYFPRDFLLPVAVKDQVTARLAEHGWRVREVPTVYWLWYSTPSGADTD